MADAMEELQVEVMTVTYDRVTGAVGYDHTGLNAMEAIGIMTTALNMLQDEPLYDSYGDTDEDE